MTKNLYLHISRCQSMHCDTVMMYVCMHGLAGVICDHDNLSSQNVLGDYDHAVKAIVMDFPNQFLGIDPCRTRRPSSTVPSSNSSSLNSSHANSDSQTSGKPVAEAKSTPSTGPTCEKREEPMAAGSTTTPLAKARHNCSSSSSYKTSSNSSSKKIPKAPRSQSKSQPIKEPNSLPPPPNTPLPGRKPGQHRSKVLPYTKPTSSTPTTSAQHGSSLPSTHSIPHRTQPDLQDSQTRASLSHSSSGSSAEKKSSSSSSSPSHDASKTHKKHKKAKEKQQWTQQQLKTELPAGKLSKPHSSTPGKSHTLSGSPPSNSSRAGNLVPIRRTSSTGGCLETLLSSVTNPESGPGEGMKMPTSAEKLSHKKKEKKQKRVESETNAGIESRVAFPPAAESRTDSASVTPCDSSRAVGQLSFSGHLKDQLPFSGHLKDHVTSSVVYKTDNVVSAAASHHTSSRQGPAHHHKHPELTINIK